ncbi:hypothetical protein HYT54_02930 [Candidatus Woesearchaeota archaeon]|nr:hypothetical protein [Candidatus Woesearchaeota archaeon]
MFVISQENEILVYLSALVLYLFLVVFLYYFVQSKAQNIANKIIAESLESRGYRVVKGPEGIEKNLIDEAIFFAGLIVITIGFLVRNYTVLLIGVFICLSSVFMLHYLLRNEKSVLFQREHPSQKAKHEALHEKAAHRTEVLESGREEGKNESEPEENEVSSETGSEAEEISMFVNLVDGLLEKIPEEEAQSFAASDKFGLYRKIVSNPPDGLNEDMKMLAPVIDSMLARIPKREIARFSRSPDFKIYKGMMEKLMKHGTAEQD